MTKRLKIEKLLVANRGEIAIRVFRAASELKIRTVAIYSYEDRYSLHRYKADEAYRIGAEDEPLKPYLDIDEIIHVAKQCGADAIHPGYGFLSERVEFVKACEQAGITFIGPHWSVMEQLGDKVKAKEIARKAKVPVIEDAYLSQVDAKSVESAGAKIGFPIMVKAAAGGGGRGMRIVRNAAQLLSACKEAQAEAQNAFGDGTIFLEKFIESPKHIEIQILGDQHGHIVHLFERDCSVQRRFQKVVEVAPAIQLSQETKDELYEYALRITRNVNYTHAGTVEFLVDPQEQAFFIEVNPRIQVEHTITEEITGIDIVRSQILIAMGYHLSDEGIYIEDQSAVQANGVAIQCRITTEDPAAGFKPDYGTMIAYRSASGFGIRLDAGSAFAGAKISPFFDSMLVKVTAHGRTMSGTAMRLHRALREFRIRGVKTNIGFLLNLLSNDTFQEGATTVQFIEDHPELLELPRRKDRGTKLLRYIGDVVVNTNEDVPRVHPPAHFRKPKVPAIDRNQHFPKGSRDELLELGRTRYMEKLRKDSKVHYTDTTFRDAHQSLIATRLRTFDMLQVAESYAKRHGGDLFSIEMWGGATFDVCMRFLKEDPWQRLKLLRQAIPNVMFQMLLRGSNAVGYSAYPDNLIIRFIEEAAEQGIDVFRIFDSLNWVKAMETSIRTVRDRTQSIAQASICYTGDVSDPSEHKFTLDYYTDLAKKLEDAGAHMIAVKDMAGLLKPRAAELLIPALKEAVQLPIHLHTHDTSSIQAATYLKAVEAGVDVIDLANSAFSGLTSQPNFNSMVAMLQGHPREHKLDIQSLNEYSVYWEAVREIYQPFETELKAGTAEVYEHEIPGGQYSNLRPQARGLGLEDQFETIKKNYKEVNELFGGIVKVTPSSKVVGDMAMFLTANGITAQDIWTKGEKLSFPDSVKALMRGDLGQNTEGFPEGLQSIILKGEKPYTERPNAHLEPIDFEQEMKAFKNEFGPYVNERDLLSFLLYPKVFRAFHSFFTEFGDMTHLPSPVFFYGLSPNEEIMVDIDKGKSLLVKYLNASEPNEQGMRQVFFSLNGQSRVIMVEDRSLGIEKVVRRKAAKENEIGAPVQGSIGKLLVSVGDTFQANQPLFTMEAMKMESTITAPVGGTVREIVLSEKTMCDANDLVLVLE